MRDQNFFHDCASGDLTPGQITRAILRSSWPESDKEIYEHDLQEKRYESTKQASKRTH